MSLSRTGRVRQLLGRARRRDEQGAALMMVMLIIVLVGALATSITVLTANNLQSASLARSGGVALDAADAGVSEAINYLRANGVTRMCPQSPTTDPTASTFSAFDLKTQTCGKNLNAAQPLTPLPYAVLIATTGPYGAATGGQYLIVSKGIGPNNARRVVAVRLQISGNGAAPLAFQGNTVRFTGQTSMDGQSIFARGCVYKRDMLTMTGTDVFGLHAAVHSEGTITEDQGNSFTCPSPSKPIHKNGPCTSPSKPEYQYDQDALGGVLPTGSPCLPTSTTLATKYYPNGSKLNVGDLQALYGIKQPPLSAEDIDNLKAVAKAQGNYYTAATYPGTVTPHGDNAVMFYENTDVTLSDVQGFRDTTTCANHSLLVVVKGGNVTWNSNSSTPLIASVMVVTDGKQFLSNGGGIIGSVYADNIVLGGAAAVSGAAQACAASNPSPSLLAFQVLSYREIDS